MPIEEVPPIRTKEPLTEMTMGILQVRTGIIPTQVEYDSPEGGSLIRVRTVGTRAKLVEALKAMGREVLEA